MSEEANKLMFWMVQQLSTMGYGYRAIVEGCYDAGVNNHGYKTPTEAKNDIVDRVITALNGL